MSQFKDLQDEFKPVKQCSITELDNDAFILRLNKEKSMVQDMGRKQETEQLDYTFNIKMNRFSKRKNHNNQSFTKGGSESKNKRRRILLVGVDELQKNYQNKIIESSQESTDSSEIPSKEGTSLHLAETIDPSNVIGDSLKQSTTIEGKKELKRKVKRHVLVPMNQEYILKAQAALKQANGAFDKSQPIDLDSDDQNDEGDVFVDADLQFHEIEVSLDELEAPLDHESPDIIVPATNGRETAQQEPEDSLTLSTHDDVLPDYSLEDTNLMRKTILEQLASSSIPNISNSIVAKPYKELQSVLARTVEDEESHMVLLIGPHGLGKSFLVEKALKCFKTTDKESFITIRLSGTLHATEQHAVREIARQLDVSLGNLRETSMSSSFEQRAISDTFHNILLTLESSAHQEKNQKDLPIRIIFMIDEIEKYTDTPKQMLLYNLFELTQNPKVPICVVGVTAKMNIRDLFEKRVRSRFSQRIITTRLPATLEEFWLNASATLKIHNEKFENFRNDTYPKSWNDSIDKLYSERSGLRSAMYQCYFTTKSIGQFKQTCMLPIKRIGVNSPFPKGEDFEIYPRNIVNGAEAKIAACSLHELMMVVAAARYVNRSDSSHVNFNLAYNEYELMIKAYNVESTTLTASGSNGNSSHIDSLALAGIKVTRAITSALIMRDCWARVYKMGLLFDALTTSNEVNAHNNLNMYKEIVLEDSRMLQLDMTLEEIRALVAGDLLLERLTKI